jgi:Polyketide cyclase / dehydrase and lipid transport
MRGKIQPIQVHVSSVIEAPLAAVWALIRDFNSLPLWHPAIADSEIEDSRESSAVGCIRKLTLKSGETVREQLLELSDSQTRFTYNILESEVGLLDYVAELSLLPITDGNQCLAIWTANFRTVSGLEMEKHTMVERDVFLGGLHALNAKLGSPG